MIQTSTRGMGDTLLMCNTSNLCKHYGYRLADIMLYQDKSHLGKASELSIASPVSVICPLESSRYSFCIMFDEQVCQPINSTLFTLFQLCIPLLCTGSSSILKTVMLLKKSSKRGASRRYGWE